MGFSLAYSSIALQQAFDGNYIIQDDARQHVFWMYRYLEPNLFPNDLIANYFQSVAPWGYSTLYWLLATCGLDPIVASKLIPTGLGLFTTYFCFQLALQFLPIPFTGFLASLLLNQNLWMQDGLISATPRAFLYPIMMAFLFAIARRSTWGICLAIATLGLFYPSLVLVCAALLILRCLSWGRGFPYVRLNFREGWLNLAGLAVAALVVLIYAASSSDFSPIVTIEQARSLPEFSANGRTSFFSDDPWQFWLNGTRSGINLTAALIPPPQLRFFAAGTYARLAKALPPHPTIERLCQRSSQRSLQSTARPSGATGDRFRPLIFDRPYCPVSPPLTQPLHPSHPAHPGVPVIGNRPDYPVRYFLLRCPTVLSLEQIRLCVAIGRAAIGGGGRNACHSRAICLDGISSGSRAGSLRILPGSASR